MPHNRFYHPFKLEKNQQINLTNEEFKHLKVMRLSKGESCEIVNGRHQLAIATIKNIDLKSVDLIIQKVISQKPPLTNVLCIALLKLKKIELILEKATELAITEFWIFNAKNSEVKELKKLQIERFEKILISAMKQCGRLDLPKISFYPSIEKIPKFNGIKLYGDTQKDAKPFSFFNSKKEKLIIIGPEMGLTKYEIAYLNQSDFTGIKLAEFILRAESAAITAAALTSQASIDGSPL